MLDASQLLLASHGTPGARAADRLALELCPRGGTLWHLVVVPDLWRGMMGDDWLNNAATRDVYGRHVESQLAAEIDRHRSDVAGECARRGIAYEARTVVGKPDLCLIEYAAAVGPRLVVMGSPRPRGVPGLRSRMNPETLVRGLAVPLLIAPYPR